jgi:histidinol phosphatase-like enzyme (inositol monophosphatase family)
MEGVMASGSDLSARLEFAIAAARRAGAIALEYFQTDFAVEKKGDNSPVTVADRRAENELRELIRSSYPDDGVLGEEYGEQVGTSGWRWILDPIDGTQSFIRGVPLFGVLIGVEHDGQAVLGAAYLPALDELVYAARGHGCWWLPGGRRATDSPRRACVSPVARLADGLMLITSFNYFQQSGQTAVYDRIVRAGRIRGWSDCYAHMLVATGRAEAAIEPIMSIWDSAPFLPILLEAGGTFTDWQGNARIDAPTALSTNGKVLEEALGLVQG